MHLTGEDLSHTLLADRLEPGETHVFRECDFTEAGLGGAILAARGISVL